MKSRRTRWFLAVLVVVALGASAACSNSGKSSASSSSSSSSSGSSSSGSSSSSGDAQRNTKVPISGVPGVTDTAINYAVIGTKSGNPLGTCILDCYEAGVKAYFAFRNSEGGIYGRQLGVSKTIDDELGQNQVKALEVISSNDSFGNFNATLLASGWGDLNDAGVPTYVWGIQAEAANREAIFGSAPVACFDCTARTIPYAAKTVGAKKVASLGYGISENSKRCAQAAANSVTKYSKDTGETMAYLNDTLDFGLPNGIGPQVTEMKNAGVDFISTCMDLNAMKTLASELDRQGMQNVRLYHPNTYNQQFVAEAGGIFDGDIVGVTFRPFESDSTGTQLADYQKWMKQTGAQESELAMIGWINADEAFTGLLAAGPEFDRAKVIAATNKLTHYTAGGLLEPINWTTQHVPPTQGDTTHGYQQECAALVKVVKGAFETVAPKDKPWLCWPNSTDAWSEPVPTNFAP